MVNPLIKVAFLNNFRRLSRTLLALLGMTIGIASLITLISVVDGVYKQANDVLGEIQGIIVVDNGGHGPENSILDLDYKEKIESVQGVKKVIPEQYFFANKIDNINSNAMDYASLIYLYGVPKKEILNSSYGSSLKEIYKGRTFNNADKDAILITKDFAEKYNKGIGSSIKINEEKFTIIGIFEVKSSFLTNLIIMDIDDMQSAFDMDKSKVSSFYVLPNNMSQSENIAKKIEFKFEDLEASTQQESAQQLGDVLGNLKLMVWVVSLIAAIVAGVGIINTMLMSVMERTKEIGTLKAVGWTDSNVMLMILFESIFVGLMGGILGIIFGYICSYIVFLISGLVTTVTITTVLQSFLFAFIIGIIGGLYPARIASKLDPIEALRSE